MKDLIFNYRLKPSSLLEAQLKLKKEESCDKMDLITKPTPNLKVGDYMRDSIISASVVGNRINEFYFLQKTIARDKLDSLKFTIRERYRTGALTYECRVYSLQIGDLKIFYNVNKRQIDRCRIVNIYNKLIDDHLDTRVDILLIDEGIKYRNVPLSRLYETPTQVVNIMDIKPSSNLARLKTNPPLRSDYQDEEVDNYFKLQLQKTKSVSVKILDFQAGYYVVDLINKQGNSLAEHMDRKFGANFEEFDSNLKREQVNTAHCYEVAFPVDPFVLANHHKRLPKKQQQANDPSYYRYYLGAIRYFQIKERDIMNSPLQLTTYSMLEQLHRVRVIYWKSPDTFYIVPNDSHYTDHFTWFKNTIAKHQEYLNSKQQGRIENHKYKIGDWCLFKNDKDPNLGKWLRGIVEKIPTMSSGLLLCKLLEKKCRITDDAKDEFSSDVLGDSINLPSDRSLFVYHIRSVDFGFECLRGDDGIMPLPSTYIPLTTKLPTWSMRCRLFGVHPLNLNNVPPRTLKFSEHCNQRVASWMYETIISDEKDSNFYVLFRSRLQDLRAYHLDTEVKADITLFHKQVFRSRIDDCFKSKKRIPEMDCLNHDLIQEGRADSRSHSSSQSSCVDLDHHIINTLIIHKFSR